MEEIVGHVNNIRFDIEVALEDQLGVQNLPFPGMDKSGAGVCTFYISGDCSRGSACPFRHVKGDRTVVCKHWLRGLCKKGDDCEFLHEYDMSKMPECYFFSKFGQCGNKECPFLHIDPEKKMKDCAWYDRGYCRHGPNCKNRHVRRVMCQNYLCGFCLDGPECKYVHPQFDIPQPDPITTAKKNAIVCHTCNEPGHKAMYCPKLNSMMGTEHAGTGKDTESQQHQQSRHFDPLHRRKPMSDLVCYKCGEKGHYASRCPKGYLAFLTNKPSEDQQQSISTIRS